jgi:thiosulfate dehydrogenase
MPLWDQQKTNTISGPDTWRCVTCHGWDYQGKDGAYRAGTNFTGFPGVYQNSQKLSREQIIAELNGTANPAHNFKDLIGEQGLNDLADFINQALIDDAQYINPVTLEVVGGDGQHGKVLFNGSCAKCHGADGQKIKFRFEGLDATLGTLSVLDPWRFLHKTRFGTPGTAMASFIGYDLGWKPQDGRDVLLYTQSLPTGLTKATPPASLAGRELTPSGQPGGPAQNWLTGLLTAFGAMATSLGFALLAGAALIGIILLLVWAMRGRGS